MEQNNEWKILNEDIKISYNNIEEKEDTIRNIFKNILLPYDFFKLFFDNNYLSQIIKNSNEYL